MRPAATYAVTTMVTIVAIVVVPNIAVTRTTCHIWPLAAGYMSNGISGSQGPNRKMVNRTHGVIEPARTVPGPCSDPEESDC